MSARPPSFRTGAVESFQLWIRPSLHRSGGVGDLGAPLLAAMKDAWMVPFSSDRRRSYYRPPNSVLPVANVYHRLEPAVGVRGPLGSVIGVARKRLEAGLAKRD